MKFDKFCTVERSANQGQHMMIRHGSGRVKNPMFIIYDMHNDEVTTEGKYKWVSEVWNKNHKDNADSEEYIKSFVSA